MKTSKLVSKIAKACNNYYSNSEILELMNDAQNELLAIDCDLMRVSPDPFLVTSDSTYQYDMSAGIRSIKSVYIRNPDINSYGGQSNVMNTTLMNERDKMGNYISRIPIYTDEATDPDELAKIHFDTDFNPTDTTIEYRLEAYLWPEQLTSTAIPMTIPTKHQTGAFMDRVMEVIDLARYGASNVWTARFRESYPSFRSEITQELNIDSEQITPWLA